MLRTVSWIILAGVGVFLLRLSLLSARVAYVTQDEGIAGVRLSASGLPDAVQKAILAQRGTAAAFAAAFATLFVVVAIGPYRKGDRWSWYALLASAATLSLLVVPRIHTLGTKAGVSAPLYFLGIVALGLLLDVKRLFPRSS